MRTMLSLHCYLLAAAFAFPLLSSSDAASESASPATDDAVLTGEIEIFLRETIEKGYRDENAGKVASAYDPDARIITPIFGELSLKEFEGELRNDFDRLTLGRVRLDLLETSFAGGEALVLVNLSVTGDLTGGRKANRHDRSWLLLRKGEKGWKIRQQSYRRDFGITESPHDFTP